MIPEFKTKPGTEYAIAKTGGFELLISPKRWILRIGAQQWTGEAQGIDHAQTLALNCMADQIREPAMFLARLKKEGVI